MSHIIVQGVRYPVITPEDLTLGEMEDAAKLGVNLSRTVQDGPDPLWLRAMILILKRRAGEDIDPESLRALRFADLEFEGDEDDADPPPNRAQRRAHAARNGSSKQSGGRATTRGASGRLPSDTTSDSAPAT